MELFLTLFCYLLIALFSLGIIVFGGGWLMVALDNILSPVVMAARAVLSRNKPPAP